MRKFICSILLFTLFNISYSPILHAQWSSDPTQNLQISNFGYDVKACEDGNGGAFIAWDLSHDQPFVWVQWVDRYGYVKWAQPIQVTGQEDNQEVLDIIKSTNNTAILAYHDKRFLYDQPPRLYKDFISLTKIDTNGNFLWDMNATVDTVIQRDLVIVPDENGGAYLTWNEPYSSWVWGDPDSTIVRLQRISNTGQRLWGDSGRYVYRAPANYYTSPYISNRIPQGIFLRYSQENIGQIMESIEPNGLVNWQNISDWYGNPIPTYDGGGVWAYLSYKPNSPFLRIMSNRMESNGNFVWNDSGLVIADNLSSISSVIDYKLLNDSSLVVFWKRQHISNPEDYKSYIQIINYDGSLQFPDSSKLITDASDGKISGTGLTISDSLTHILLWKDYRSNDTGYYCQKYDKYMNKLWDSTDVLFSTHGASNRNVISDKNYGLLMVWSEWFSPGTGIYGQQINKHGSLGEPLTKIKELEKDNMINEFILYQNYPNPFNSETSIKFYSRKKSDYNLNIYNLLGQKVKSYRLLNKNGINEFYWDAKNDLYQILPSGVYYIELKSKNYTQTIKSLLK